MKLYLLHFTSEHYSFYFHLRQALFQQLAIEARLLTNLKALAHVHMNQILNSR